MNTGCIDRAATIITTRLEEFIDRTQTQVFRSDVRVVSPTATPNTCLEQTRHNSVFVRSSLGKQSKEVN